MLIAFIIASALIFSYTLYKLIRDDFLLVRRNITPEIFFNGTFFILLFALYVGRLGYVVFHFSPKYLNPLVFFYFPYFPGISLVGTIIGGVVGSFFLSRLKKVPFAKCLDFLSFATVSVMPIGYFYISLLQRKSHILFLCVAGMYLFLFFLFQYIVFPKLFRGELKDGTAGNLFLASFAVFTLLLFFLQRSPISLLSIIYLILLFLMFCAALIFLFLKHISIPLVKKQ